MATMGGHMLKFKQQKYFLKSDSKKNSTFPFVYPCTKIFATFPIFLTCMIPPGKEGDRLITITDLKDKSMPVHFSVAVT